jgi:RNA polymerase sigma factor (sigma-70 family)
VSTPGRQVNESAFSELAEKFRAELQLHCYRILGSVQDAEDLVQETLLAAWRGHERFEGRSSLRTWLYRIATNRSLNALRDRGRRPHALQAPPEGTPAPPQPTRLGESVWLEPYPDLLLDGVADRAQQPEARYETREAIGLAFVTAWGAEIRSPCRAADSAPARETSRRGRLTLSEGEVGRRYEGERALWRRVVRRPTPARVSPDSPRPFRS